MDYINYISFLLENKSDPRTSKWFLMSSPTPILIIVAVYLLFCLFFGPRFMKERKPFELKNTIQIYNFVQIIFSIILVYEGLVAGWAFDYKFTCQPVDYSNHPKAIRMARTVWLYFICKIVELLDTVFFILRKKNNQVSFLHLYHHAMMPICSWIGVKFLPGGHGTLLGLINSFIHIIMYSYYFLAALGPQFQKYLWWKKYLTVMQMIQFCIIVVHNAQLLPRDCNYPKEIVLLMGLQTSIILVLFGNFYYKSYVIKNRKTIECLNNNIPNEKYKIS